MNNDKRNLEVKLNESANVCDVIYLADSAEVNSKIVETYANNQIVKQSVDMHIKASFLLTDDQVKIAQTKIFETLSCEMEYILRSKSNVIVAKCFAYLIGNTLTIDSLGVPDCLSNGTLSALAAMHIFMKLVLSS